MRGRYKIAGNGNVFFLDNKWVRFARNNILVRNGVN